MRNHHSRRRGVTRGLSCGALGLACLLAGCQSNATSEAAGPITAPIQSAALPADDRYTAYGEAFSAADLPMVDAAAAVDAEVSGEPVRVRGEVSDVCRKKGCWLTLATAEAGEPIFVKFTCPIDGRLIPTEAIGRQAVVEGTLSRRQVSESYARHLKEDAGATPEEIAAIQGPQEMWFIASPAARVYGLGAASDASTQR